MKRLGFFFISSFFLFSCNSSKHLILPGRSKAAITGDEFYKSVFAVSRVEREASAKNEILQGNIPAFLRKMVKIKTSITTNGGKVIHAYYFVLPDYLSIGSSKDFSRIPLTPMTAQPIADSLHCFLPTRKMVNDIYNAAKVKLEPVPMYAFRDSAVTMYQHNLIIEGQRKLRKGLIAGIKKDVVITGMLTRSSKPNRVAIYGWQKSDGKPIQPLYTGHVNWYVDYSHGIRLIYRTIYVNKKPMDYIAVLKDPVLKRLLCDEEYCDCYRYETTDTGNKNVH
ncbi:MAG: hypothetical protein KGM16_06030 [Bacteroidota bacterium]|nr:hypothetical protein [Bacteroidota bacterium]